MVGLQGWLDVISLQVVNCVLASLSLYVTYLKFFSSSQHGRSHPRVISARILCNTLARAAPIWSPQVSEGITQVPSPSQMCSKPGIVASDSASTNISHCEGILSRTDWASGGQCCIVSKITMGHERNTGALYEIISKRTMVDPLMNSVPLMKQRDKSLYHSCLAAFYSSKLNLYYLIYLFNLCTKI
jgi:hypothetical protein